MYPIRYIESEELTLDIVKDAYLFQTLESL